MLCCVQSGETALSWAIWKGYVNIVQILVNHGAAVDYRDKVTNCDYLLTCGWSSGCGSLLSLLVLIYSIVIPGLMRAIRPCCVKSRLGCQLDAWFIVQECYVYHNYLLWTFFTYLYSILITSLHWYPLWFDLLFMCAHGSGIVKYHLWLCHSVVFHNESWL